MYSRCCAGVSYRYSSSTVSGRHDTSATEANDNRIATAFISRSLGADGYSASMNDDVLTAFRASPQSAGIFTDFDGTLSRIVEIPSEARPIEGARDLLRRLAERYALVSIVSGRSAKELLAWLGSDIEIWGVHGAETVVDGEVVLSPRAEK